MRGVEGRVHQGIMGEYVYQDKKGFDENLGMEVFTGDELVRKGASLKVRLEGLKKLADKRGALTTKPRRTWKPSWWRNGIWNWPGKPGTGNRERSRGSIRKKATGLSRPCSGNTGRTTRS